MLAELKCVMDIWGGNGIHRVSEGFAPSSSVPGRLNGSGAHIELHSGILLLILSVRTAEMNGDVFNVFMGSSHRNPTIVKRRATSVRYRRSWRPVETVGSLQLMLEERAILGICAPTPAVYTSIYRVSRVAEFGIHCTCKCHTQDYKFHNLLHIEVLQKSPS